MNFRSPLFLAAFLLAAPLVAQDMPMPMPEHQHPPATQQQPKESESDEHQGMEMAAHGAMSQDEVSELLMRQASGTSMNPAASHEPMKMWMRGDWMVMAHGLAFVNQVFQSGPRGGDKLFSTNWAMGMAERKVGPGHLMLRTMLSLEPATITNRRYPELFQTGETAFGRPLHDAQHPHDAFMEIAAEYAVPAFDRGIAYLYVAPVGDPSLGPVAFPHRASSQELPQATLGHHVQDSTHIANSVATLGMMSGAFGAAVSAFHGGEPDEQRWDIDGGRIDSWAARVTWDPTPHWTTQLSTGHIRHPEALEPGDVQRTTASVQWSDASRFGDTSWSAVWGRNDKSEGSPTSSWLVEGLLRNGANAWTTRAEIVDKDELFTGEPVPPSIAGRVFRIRALTAGYTRDVTRLGSVMAGIGGNVTLYAVPRDIRPYYGSSPKSAYLYLRFRMAEERIESGM